ncbi:MAG TPA: FecR family protein [Kiloniellales bacterium]|nr:FecR family protein [Kiloniellales bacterium]
MSRRYPRRSALQLAGAAGLVAVLPRTAPAEEPTCRVLQLVGEAWRDVGGTQSPLALGDGLSAGDRVGTGSDSKVKLLFVDGSALIVGPESEVGVAIFDPQPKEGVALFLLLVGTLRVSVGDSVSWQSYEVQGGTAVASVRATEWAMQVDAKGTAVLCVDGAVHVRPRLTGGTTPEPGMEGVVLQPGEGTDVAPNTAPTPPKTWGAARRDKLLALLTLP